MNVINLTKEDKLYLLSILKAGYIDTDSEDYRRFASVFRMVPIECLSDEELKRIASYPIDID